MTGFSRENVDEFVVKYLGESQGREMPFAAGRTVVGSIADAHAFFGSPDLRTVQGSGTASSQTK